MFGFIKTRRTRPAAFGADWDSLCEAGYPDVPKDIGRRHAREKADFDRLGLHPMGSLR